jgi:hypothetical protein
VEFERDIVRVATCVSGGRLRPVCRNGDDMTASYPNPRELHQTGEFRTHAPQDARPADGITVLSCPAEEAVQIVPDAAGGKNAEVFSPTIGRQLLERGLIDEIDLHIAPIPSAPASASMTTRLTTGSSGFTGSATAIPLRRSTCGTGPSLPVGGGSCGTSLSLSVVAPGASTCQSCIKAALARSFLVGRCP